MCKKGGLTDYALEFVSNQQLVDCSKPNNICEGGLKDCALKYLSDRQLVNCSKQNSV